MKKVGAKKLQLQPAKRLQRMRTRREELIHLTNRIQHLLKGSRLSTRAVLDAYETSLVDAGLGD